MQQHEPGNRWIRAAIVSAEARSRSRIRQLLDKERDVDLVGNYEDAAGASAGIAAIQPDLLLLDLQLPRGAAFPLLELFAADPARATIVLRALDGNAMKAFEWNAVDCLQEPFDAGRFRRSVERARRYFVGSMALAQSSRSAPSRAEHLVRLAVKTNGRVYVLRMEEVDWIETAGNYVRLHVGGISHLYRNSLADFETRLDPRRFVRIHRSTIVNVDRIFHLEPTFRREHVVLLRDGTRLTLAAPYRGRMQALVGAF